jgi:tRNA pseudouridine-54 N-methylase
MEEFVVKEADHFKRDGIEKGKGITNILFILSCHMAQPSERRSAIEESGSAVRLFVSQP